MTKPTKWHVRPAKTDEPGHPPSLIRVFTVRLKKAMILIYPLSVQRRLWSDWVDAQADLNLRWAHMPFRWFCHDAAHMLMLEPCQLLNPCVSPNRCLIKLTLLEPHHAKTCLCHMRTTIAQISLRIRAIWPTPLLFAACGCAGRFESYLVANPEDRFSRDEAHWCHHSVMKRRKLPLLLSTNSS